MFRSLIVSAALTLLVSWPTFAQQLPVAAPEKVGLSSDKLKEVGRLMRQRVNNQKIAGGVVVIARRGKVVFFEAYGQRDKDTGKPMERDTIFRLYSMSKAITTAAALMLVDEGKITLDDPVAKYLPELAAWKVKTPGGCLVKPSRAITIQDLMLHTTGMADNDAYKDITLWNVSDSSSFVKRLTKVPLIRNPGQEWTYSRSVNLLGLVIEKVSGESLAKFLHKRLFDPLGMVDTAFSLPKEKRDRFATFYTRTESDDDAQFSLKRPSNEAMEVAVTRFLSPPKVAMGGAGLIGTAEDYLRFLLMIANEGKWKNRQYLSEESIRLMTTNQLARGLSPIALDEVRHGIGFGCGFCVCMTEGSWEKGARVDEFGWAGAACTHYWVSPRDDDLIVVTMEQIWPTNRDTRFQLRPIIYRAIQ